MKRIISFLLAIFISMTGRAADDIELIRKRFTDTAREGTTNLMHVKNLMQTLQDDGTWPGIDYHNTGREAFQHTIHLANMVSMARAYSQQDGLLRYDKKLKKKLFTALDYWLANDFKCENWWHNQIGTPTVMLSLLYMLDKQLSSQQQQAMLRIAERANMNAEGARPSGDRIRIAGLHARKALWQRNTQEVEEALQTIESEMELYNLSRYQAKLRPHYFAGGHGMEADYSFHHRPDNVNNTLTYGESFAVAFTEWAVKVADTKYRFSDKSIRMLTDYYLDGMCKQMVFGISTDPGVMNRDMARQQGRNNQAENFIPESLLHISDYRSLELRQLLQIRQGNTAERPSFAKMFWNTDHFVFQRPSYYTSVRMYSRRCANMEEPYNGEGFTNHFRADGANYLSITGEEYTDIYPTFDFHQVPGATILQEVGMPAESALQRWGVTTFVGGVTDSLYGAAAFDFISPHNLLRAKKAWFFFDHQYVCLGTDIGCYSDNPVYTTINQCYLQGDVTMQATQEDRKILPLGVRTVSQTCWVHHHKTGYLSLDSTQRFGIANRQVIGSWRNVNRQTIISDTPVSNNIFTLWIDHGRRLRNGGSYAYMVLPGADVEETARQAAYPEVNILANTSAIQAVEHPGCGIAYIVFYEAGSITINKKITIRSETPALLLVKYHDGQIDRITAADPTHLLSRLSLTVRETDTMQHCNSQHVCIELPHAEWAGKSTSVVLHQSSSESYEE